MSGSTNLQTLLAKTEGGTVSVDLFKIGQACRQLSNEAKKNSTPNDRFRIALDMENCLDRFYGGYYSDWACGGQWNRAYQFVQLLATAFNSANIEIIAFFDGTLKSNRCQMSDLRQKTLSVLKHIRVIGTPPPKIWWIPPSGIRNFLRNAMRSINIQVIQTVHDHTSEIVEYYHEYKLNGIMGLHSDYIFSNVARYFSSHELRLSYRGVLETKEYVISKLLSNLNITPNHLPFLRLFLGNDNLIDESSLKILFEKIDIDSKFDFEMRIKHIAEIVENSKFDVDEFIKKLNLSDYDKIIRDIIQKYQQKSKGKKSFYSFQKNEKPNLVRNNIQVTDLGKTAPAEDLELNLQSPDQSQNSKITFVYTIPGEVIKTALNRHQRGIMDARIYQLLIKKEIVLPHILEDEHYSDNSSINIFYRPARQMVYAILFNLYHQKYLCSKNNKNLKKTDNFVPEVKIQEWIWKQQSEFKIPDVVHAITLPWAVPTIQRLWFGTSLEDKQRRMKAFLTIMRSDSPLMLNRSYVPQHMLVMACVLRYIITNPNRNMLTRPELDAFLATAFSPQLVHIEYTQNLTLPGVNLRGVYLASLFTQGIETASFANDVCGVPLPWMMTNPWLFFDGKLFHLKLKMSTYVQNLRELCDNHIDIVLKIERFRKAILDDVEHNFSYQDVHYRSNFIHPIIGQTFNKIHPLQSSIPSFEPPTSNYYNNNIHMARYNDGFNGRDKFQLAGPIRNGRINPREYQLKVGGIVVGSWADGNTNKTVNNYKKYAASSRNSLPRRKTTTNSNVHRMPVNNSYHQSNLSRTINRRVNGRVNYNRNRRNKKRFVPVTDEKKKNVQPAIKNVTPKVKMVNKENTALIEQNSTEIGLQNGINGTATSLVKIICDEILKEDLINSTKTITEISETSLSEINVSEDTMTLKNNNSQQLQANLNSEECG